MNREKEKNGIEKTTIQMAACVRMSTHVHVCSC